MPSQGRTRPPEAEGPSSGVKRPFDIDEVLSRIGGAIRPFRKAAMFELADEGFTSVFEQLIACIISIRTRDESTVPVAKKLFAAARTPEAIAALSVSQIDRLIDACTFHQPKAATIRAIAQRTAEEFGGALPCDEQVLLSFNGVGPKCAHLALGVACGASRISVDVHVHRVANRWGYVRAASPGKTMAQLEMKLPRRYWIDINRLLVPFGKHICTGQSPRCSTCPVLEFCRQAGVTRHR